MADTQNETAAAPKQPQRPVMFQDRARIEWLDADGKVVNKELCLRGLGPLVDRLSRESSQTNRRSSGSGSRLSVIRVARLTPTESRSRSCPLKTSGRRWPSVLLTT